MITRVYTSPDHEGLVIEFDNGDGGLFELEPDAMELTEVDRVLDDDGWRLLDWPCVCVPDACFDEGEPPSHCQHCALLDGELPCPADPTVRD